MEISDELLKEALALGFALALERNGFGAAAIEAMAAENARLHDLRTRAQAAALIPCTPDTLTLNAAKWGLTTFIGLGPDKPYFSAAEIEEAKRSKRIKGRVGARGPGA